MPSTHHSPTARHPRARRLAGLATAALLGLSAMPGWAQQLPPLEQKDSYRVGFAQMESNNPWRIAETKSFKDSAESCNWDLIATDAAGSAAKQVADVDSMIAQGIDVLFLPPREEKPLIPAVKKAKAAAEAVAAQNPPPPPTPTTSAPASAINGRISPVPTPKWMRGTPVSATPSNTRRL